MVSGYASIILRVLWVIDRSKYGGIIYVARINYFAVGAEISFNKRLTTFLGWLKEAICLSSNRSSEIRSRYSSSGPEPGDHEAYEVV